MLENATKISLPPRNDTLTQHPPFQDTNGTWFLTRYDDVRFMLTNENFLRKPPGSRGLVHALREETPLDDVLNRWSLFNDPPTHTRLRGFLSKVVNPKFIKETKTLIEKVADDLLKEMLCKTEVDFMQTFSYPFPTTIINHLLGTDLDPNLMRDWAVAFGIAMDHGSPEDFKKITPVIMDMRNYFHNLMFGNERSPSGWIKNLLAAQSEFAISDEDMVATCIFLLLAGHETLQLSTGLGLIHLKENPDQQELLLNNPALINGAVEEMLRFEAPLALLSRWTAIDIIVGDKLIPKDNLVVAVLNAANRDPLRFPNPNRFDISRQNNRHLTFGHGIHNCLGAILARFELQVAFSKLLPHLSKFEIHVDKSIWLEITSLRYLFSLPMTIHHES